MASLGLHFPFEDSHVHIKIPNTFVCFFPVALSYICLILRPTTGPKGVEADYTSQLKNAQERGTAWARCRSLHRGVQTENIRTFAHLKNHIL